MSQIDKHRNSFEKKVVEHRGDQLRPSTIDTIQVNITLRCNLHCVHCHVASSPKRVEQMSWALMEKVIALGKLVKPEKFDITGGAPEIHPEFRRFVKALKDAEQKVMVRTNLTILTMKPFASLPYFFKKHRVHLVASLPCYFQENVDQQRGIGTFRKSLAALKTLNDLGYGREKELVLDLVYNPIGPTLPAPQIELEKEYKKRLGEAYDIVFTHLYTLTNMPIGMFQYALHREGKLTSYQNLLEENFNPSTLDNVMCVHQIHIAWDGKIYDCDFNFALKRQARNGKPFHLDDLDLNAFRQRAIAVDKHCFGCTAGAGSSCCGVLLKKETAEKTA